MKILVVSSTWWPNEQMGGPIFTVKRLMEELSAQGHTVSIHTPRQMMLGDRIAEADLVYLVGVYNPIVWPTLLRCRQFKKSLVWSGRGGWQRWKGSRHVRLKRIWDALLRYLAPPWTVIHATSQFEADSIVPVLPFPIRVVANGVDVPDTLPERSDSDQFRCTFLGRFDPKKGLDELIDAILCLPTVIPLQLSIYGQGSSAYTTRVRTASAKAKNIHWYGHVPHDHLADVFRRTDLTIVPSHIESFGQVVAESLAHGVPALIGNNMPWEIETHKAGFRVSIDRINLAVSLLALAQAHAMCREGLPYMGYLGRQWMQQEFQWTDKAKEMAAVFAYALSRQSAGI